VKTSPNLVKLARRNWGSQLIGATSCLWSRSGFILSRTVVVAMFLLTTAPRLPAPIVEENSTPVPEQSVKPKVKHSKPKSEDDSGKPKHETESTPKPSGVARNLDGPKPGFPPEAAGLHLSGTGKYLLQFDQNTGKVTDVTVAQSAGSPILDDAAVAAFRQWHEDPHCAREVTMTMTFTSQQTGAQ
jgi:TonB family protein